METLLPFSRHVNLVMGSACAQGLIVSLPGAATCYECCCKNQDAHDRCRDRFSRREDILIHMANQHTIAFDYLKRGALDLLVSEIYIALSPSLCLALCLALCLSRPLPLSVPPSPSDGRACCLCMLTGCEEGSRDSQDSPRHSRRHGLIHRAVLHRSCGDHEP